MSKYWSLKTQLIMFLAVFILSILPILSGAKLLTYVIVESIVFPVGNLLGALAIFMLAKIHQLTFILQARKLSSAPKTLFYVNKFIVLASLLWLPLTYLLAGNLAASFGSSNEFQGSTQAGVIFFWFTVTIPLMIASIWIVFILLWFKYRIYGGHGDR